MSTNNLMNSKSECNSSRIPRIIIEEGDRQKEDETSGLSQNRTDTTKSRELRQEVDNENGGEETKRKVRKGELTKPDKRQNTDREGESNKRIKIMIEKRISKDTEARRAEAEA